MITEPRYLWHWAYHNYGSIKLEVSSKSDNDKKIWRENQKQKVRCIINGIPQHHQAFGNVMYMPTGDVSPKDLDTLQTYAMNRVRVRLTTNQVIMPPNEDGKPDFAVLVKAALNDFHDTISPVLDGEVPKRGAGVRTLVKYLQAKGYEIDERAFRQRYKKVWKLIKNEIKDIDAEAIEPLEVYIQESIKR